MFAEALIHFGAHIGKPPGYERLVRLLYPPEKCRTFSTRMLALRNEPVILADPRTPLGWHLLFFGTYEPEIRRLFNAVLRPGGVAVDVGANIGWHTLLLAQLVGATGRVLAFEPNKTVRAVLDRHVTLNGFQQVDVFPYALSDVAQTVRFYAPSAEHQHSGDGFVLGMGDNLNPDVVELQTRTFDSLVNELQLTRLDLIKLDIEGYEYRALLGAQAALRRFRPLIVMEFNEEFLYRGQSSRAELEKLLTCLEYETFVLSRTGCRASEATNWPACTEIVAIPRLQND